MASATAICRGVQGTLKVAQWERKNDKEQRSTLVRVTATSITKGVQCVPFGRSQSTFSTEYDQRAPFGRSTPVGFASPFSRVGGIRNQRMIVTSAYDNKRGSAGMDEQTHLVSVVLLAMALAAIWVFAISLVQHAIGK